jgi:hypothetical protein
MDYLQTPRPSQEVEDDQRTLDNMSTTEETLISRTKHIPQFTPEPFIFASKNKDQSNSTFDEYFVCLFPSPSPLSFTYCFLIAWSPRT